MPRKPSKERAGSIYLLAQRDVHTRRRIEVDVDARAEADETVALPAHELLARFGIAQDAPGDQAGHLHAGDVVAARGAQPQRVSLVLVRRLVQGGVDEAARVIPALLHPTVDRTAVGMNVEDVHEDAHLQGASLQVR